MVVDYCRLLMLLMLLMLQMVTRHRQAIVCWRCKIAPLITVVNLYSPAEVINLTFIWPPKCINLDHRPPQWRPMVQNVHNDAGDHDDGCDLDYDYDGNGDGDGGQLSAGL